MKNKLFQVQPPEARENKLCTIIRSRTNDALTPEELQRILARASSVFQYTIAVHTLPDVFCDAVTTQAAEDNEIVFGQIAFGSESTHAIILEEQQPAAAMITNQKNGEKQSTIHIYVPLHLYEERKTSHGQREKEAHSL